MKSPIFSSSPIAKLTCLLFLVAAAGCTASTEPIDDELVTTESAVVARVPFYRAYAGYKLTHPSFIDYKYIGGDHFYTTDRGEVSRAEEGEYRYESVAGTCLTGPTTIDGSTATKFIRMYNLATTDHFYTTDEMEASKAEENGYVREDFNQCYVFTTQVPGSCPIYRLWNAKIGDHFYTMSRREVQSAETASDPYYTYEWIAGFMYPYNSTTCPQ